MRLLDRLRGKKTHAAPPPCPGANRAERRRKQHLLSKTVVIDGVLIADECKDLVELFYAKASGKHVIIGVRKKTAA